MMDNTINDTRLEAQLDAAAAGYTRHSSTSMMMTAMITQQSLMISNRQYHSPLRRQRHSSRRHSSRHSRSSPQTATA